MQSPGFTLAVSCKTKANMYLRLEWMRTSPHSRPRNFRRFLFVPLALDPTATETAPEIAATGLLIRTLRPLANLPCLAPAGAKYHDSQPPLLYLVKAVYRRDRSGTLPDSRAGRPSPHSPPENLFRQRTGRAIFRFILNPWVYRTLRA